LIKVREVKHIEMMFHQKKKMMLPLEATQEGQIKSLEADGLMTTCRLLGLS
jgi:hypothetical protein